MNHYFSEVMRYVEHLHGTQWLMVLAVAAMIGIFCMRGFGIPNGILNELKAVQLLLAFDMWSLHISPAMALAIVAALGYLVGRHRRAQENQGEAQSRRELRRAMLVARELEKIARGVRKGLAQHQTNLRRFKRRVTQLDTEEMQTSWRELCREAEQILKPTLQLTNQIAGAYELLRQQSANLMTFSEVRTDPLTRVSNRRALDETLLHQFALLKRYPADFSVVMFDIDHFKDVNDQRGHLQGDRILQQVARLLDESVRESDIVARFGGEEYVVVLPQTDLMGASTFAERTRLKIAQETPITVSVGVAAAERGESPERFMARADLALYAAKHAGRNQVFRNVGGDAVESLMPAEMVAIGQTTNM